MFGIGSSEFLVILVVAFLVLGPSHLPKIARTLGKAMGEFRRVSSEFQRTLNLEVEQEEHEQRKRQAEKEFFTHDDEQHDEQTAKKDEEKAADHTMAEQAGASPKPAEPVAAKTEVEKAVEAAHKAASSKEQQA